MAAQLLRIGELAAQCGVSTRTVDFYTQLGLIAPAKRSAGNFRLYDTAAVERIRSVRMLEEHGVNLSDIAAALQGTGSSSFGETLSSLTADLGQLSDLAATASAEVHAMLAIVAMRTHALISAAIDMAGG